jgi:pyruvate/2-oxoglutarate dehydrogenase complex dihydrolipoamide acyltransferase (E2) component
MDVEAQEDGVLAKIIIPDGTHNIKVGKTIAVLAEKGDDISSVELLAEDSQSTQLAVSNPDPAGTNTMEQPSQKGSLDHEKSLHFALLYPPAVLRLLQEYGIEEPKAIPATGPKGRLLKGDILAYVGSIKSDAPKTLMEILAKKQNLDLSNIIVRPRQTTDSRAQSSMLPASEPPATAHVDAIIRFTELFRIQRQLSGLSELLHSLMCRNILFGNIYSFSD